MFTVFLRQAVFQLPQKDFAAAAGVTQATISRWEAGDFNPKLSTMIQLLSYARSHGIDLRPEDFFSADRLQKLMAENPPPKRRRGRKKKSQEISAE